MEFDGVVFFGRLGEQALAMFHLEAELPRWQGARVLDCPGGPGSLAARLRPCGIDMTAVDPLYALGDEAIERDARHHPYAEALLAELPSAWRGGFFASSYDQGHQGLTHGLTLQRRDSPPQPASPSSRSMPATTTSATSWMR